MSLRDDLRLPATLSLSPPPPRGPALTSVLHGICLAELGPPLPGHAHNMLLSPEDRIKNLGQESIGND